MALLKLTDLELYSLVVAAKAGTPFQLPPAAAIPRTQTSSQKLVSNAGSVPLLLVIRFALNSFAWFNSWV